MPAVFAWRQKRTDYKVTRQLGHCLTVMIALGECVCVYQTFPISIIKTYTVYGIPIVP